MPRLNQEETDNLNRLITSSEIEFVIKNSPSKQKPSIEWLGEFYQTYNKELIPTFLKVFQKTKENETLRNSSYKATITLIPQSKIVQKNKVTGQYLL